MRSVLSVISDAMLIVSMALFCGDMPLLATASMALALALALVVFYKDTKR